MQIHESSSGTQSPLSLELRRTYAATPERVYRAWTTAAELSRWWQPMAGGPPAEVLELDVRPGGNLKVILSGPNGPRTVSGTYIEVSPSRRLLFTWLWDGHPESKRTTVTVEFSAAVGGGCDLVFRHEGFPGQNMVDQHKKGWSAILDSLPAFLSATA